MASKVAARVSQSAVDWARFAAVIPKAQIETLRMIKAKHDNFINKVHQLPENLPKIDFGGYKSRLPDPTMADRFKKAYETLSVPYPTDKANLLKNVDLENEDMEKSIKELIAAVHKDTESSKSFLAKIDSLPKLNEMTIEMYQYYFIETGNDPQRPTIWPHLEDEQPYTMKEGVEDHH